MRCHRKRTANFRKLAREPSSVPSQAHRQFSQARPSAIIGPSLAFPQVRPSGIGMATSNDWQEVMAAFDECAPQILRDMRAEVKSARDIDPCNRFGICMSIAGPMLCVPYNPSHQQNFETFLAEYELQGDNFPGIVTDFPLFFEAVDNQTGDDACTDANKLFYMLCFFRFVQQSYNLPVPPRMHAVLTDPQVIHDHMEAIKLRLQQLREASGITPRQRLVAAIKDIPFRAVDNMVEALGKLRIARSFEMDVASSVATVVVGVIKGDFFETYRQDATMAKLHTTLTAKATSDFEGLIVPGKLMLFLDMFQGQLVRAQTDDAARTVKNASILRIMFQADFLVKHLGLVVPETPLVVTNPNNTELNICTALYEDLRRQLIDILARSDKLLIFHISYPDVNLPNVMTEAGYRFVWGEDPVDATMQRVYTEVDDDESSTGLTVNTISMMLGTKNFTPTTSVWVVPHDCKLTVILETTETGKGNGRGRGNGRGKGNGKGEGIQLVNITQQCQQS